MWRGLGRLGLGATVLVAFTLAAADEVVYFTNGAEMPVRSHTVEKDKGMVKLDLGGNSFISFPLGMVDKIADAGRDVFLNPSYHPANQAVEGSARLTPPPVVGGEVRNSGGNVGFQPPMGRSGSLGNALGEPTIGTDAPAYSKSPAGVTTLPVQRSRGVLQTATVPTFKQVGPLPPTGQAVINSNANTAGPPVGRAILKPVPSVEPPAAPPQAPSGNDQAPSGDSPAAPPPPPPPPPDDSSGQS